MPAIDAPQLGIVSRNSQLTMPGPNRDDLYGSPSASQSFSFNSEQPTKTAIQTGLAVLCFLLVVRFCLQRGVAWLRQSHHFANTQEPIQPRAPIFDEKMQPRSFSCSGRDSAEQRSSGDESDVAGASAPAPRALPERQRRILTRLPPAPPLTPPELSATIFACEEEVDGFINQPNPDYMSATSSLPFQEAQPTPRRRSYMKTFTSGGPLPTDDNGSLVPTLSVSSYPSSPLLPPPPPRTQSRVQTHEEDAPRHNVDVKGEIISLVNEDGAGWTRHTRVYGGGVCLACAASGGHEGGFYGATVTPEEMRY